MATSNHALKFSLATLMLSSALELALISTMVYWLHHRASGSFEITYPPDTTTSFPLHGEPLRLLVDQGHTSNGAAGTAFVLVGLGGLLALWLRSRRKAAVIYYIWLLITLLSMFLTLAALVYTFILTYAHTDQSINLDLASRLDDRASYPLDQWTPENWFDAVLKTDLTHEEDREEIRVYLYVMRAWRWNLIAMSVLGVGVCGVAIQDAWRGRREERRRGMGKGEGA